MDRKRQTLNMIWMAVVGAFVAVSFTGCGKPMLYHFKHYHRPFAAISKSNQTYFHSSQTGKIIEKDPCASYCEPGCYGYEPTCWTRWPSDCEGACPMQGEVSGSEYGMPYEGAVMSDGAMMMEQSSVLPPGPVYQEATPEVDADLIQPSIPALPDAPTPGSGTRLPAIRVPSLPADVESAVPSPSDSTILLPRQDVQPSDNARSIVNDTIKKPIAERVQVKPQRAITSAKPAPTHSILATPKPATQPKSLLVKPVPQPKLAVEELDPLPAKKVAQLPEKVKPILKSANKPLDLEEAKTSRPFASSRKAKTLTEKLRVRSNKPAKRVVTDTAAAKLPVKPQPKATRLQLGGDDVTIQIVEKVQPKANLNTAQVLLPKAKDTDESVIRFSNTDLASKLKNAKPAVLNRSKTTVKPKVVKPQAVLKVRPKSIPKAVLSETSVVKVKVPKATMNVSTGESSVLRFANAKGGKEINRLTAPQGSTVLRFANDR